MFTQKDCKIWTTSWNYYKTPYDPMKNLPKPWKCSSKLVHWKELAQTRHLWCGICHCMTHLCQCITWLCQCIKLFWQRIAKLYSSVSDGSGSTDSGSSACMSGCGTTHFCPRPHPPKSTQLSSVPLLPLLKKLLKTRKLSPERRGRGIKPIALQIFMYSTV